MVISHKYKFIFIKTRKTAGTSIEVFLSQKCADSDIFTPIFPHVEPHIARNYGNFRNHFKGSKIREEIDPKIWKNYFKWCVERNPWDKSLSHYHMLNSRRNNKLSFEQYLSNGDFCKDLGMYTEPENKNKILVDKIVYYENLIEELTQLFEIIGIPFEGTLGVNAKSEYRSDRRPYQEVYTEAQAKIIEQAFSHEIKLHGYSFVSEIAKKKILSTQLAQDLAIPEIANKKTIPIQQNLDLSQKLFEIFKDDTSNARFVNEAERAKILVTLSAFAWNYAITKDEDSLRNSVEHFKNHFDSSILEELLLKFANRKFELFPDDNRLIKKCHISQGNNGEFKLTVDL